MIDRRVALISGASRGIGAAIGERLVQEGWAVSLGMRRPQQPVWGLEAHLQAYEATGAEAEADWVAAALERFGRIDAVVANAGIMLPKSVIKASGDEMRAMLEVNVLAPQRLAQAAWPALKASGRGRVAILASLSGKRVKSARAGAYAMSKFAAVALAHGLRHEGFEHGIRATAICPGFVATDMGTSLSDRPAEAMTDPADLARIVAMILDLPNEASVAEFAVNCQLEESF
ncbi:short-chain dehydrogenase [Cereibacter changlensis JA139]|uniref:Short-chain dehydrogenase n=2 Tax=Cereibacter changlensis TaxID=402884 RepID=A0A2T4JZP1_9RHOB|nr:SDR family NAD(P)-dependent oxidoreductase [Cereibacter changlensis]PTE23380.1 short-chain dehydrogenase [Cereibacter changlensis JA139]PZX49772.1 NADP-dependent 3-hydroxy acid dehydrogenase YdfG [Cereibacter changlensis]